MFRVGEFVYIRPELETAWHPRVRGVPLEVLGDGPELWGRSTVAVATEDGDTWHLFPSELSRSYYRSAPRCSHRFPDLGMRKSWCACGAEGVLDFNTGTYVVSGGAGGERQGRPA